MFRSLGGPSSGFVPLLLCGLGLVTSTFWASVSPSVHGGSEASTPNGLCQVASHAASRLINAQPSPRAAEGRRGVMWGDGPFPFDTSQLFEGQGRSSTCPMCMVAPVLTALWTECFPDMDGGHRYWEPKTDAGGLEGEIHDTSTSHHQASWPKGAGRVTSHSP